jgi:hypothetical protein
MSLPTHAGARRLGAEVAVARMAVTRRGRRSRALLLKLQYSSQSLEARDAMLLVSVGLM